MVYGIVLFPFTLPLAGHGFHIQSEQSYVCFDVPMKRESMKFVREVLWNCERNH